MTYAETDLIASIERLSGGELAALTQAQRDQLDQFHGGGAEAVDRVLTALQLEPTMTVLDVGAGLGGPARQVSRTSGATVIGVDITRAYVETAQALTRAAGQHARVSFVCSDVGSLARADFDAGYTMHVQMNIADKPTFFREIAAHLRPGAHFATFEVCGTDESRPSLPLPWSLDGSDSFLIPPDELCDTIQASGFELVEWVDETAWIREWFARRAPGIARSDAGATLRGLLDDGPRRMMNFATGLADGTFTVHRGTFTRARSFTESTLDAAETRFQLALLTNDVAALDDVLHDDVRFVGPDGTTIDKAADMALHRSQAFTLTAIDELDREVQVIDGVGITRTTLHLVGATAGADVLDMILAYTRIWIPPARGWLIVAAHGGQGALTK